MSGTAKRLIGEADEIPSVCAWCLKEEGKPSPPGVSHGMCKRHRDIWLKEIEKRPIPDELKARKRDKPA